MGAFIAAGIALYIYQKQHRDEKRDAAEAVFSEIATAENRLKGIRERFFAVPFPQLESSLVLGHENWNRYKYLFIKNLTTAEWESIENFYINCVNYDAAVKLNNSYFDIDAQNMFRAMNEYYSKVINKFHETQPNEDVLSETQKNDLSKFQNKLLQNYTAMAYRPQKPLNDARVALVALDTNISLSSAGTKLKKLARLI